MLNGMSAVIYRKIIDQYSEWTLIQTLSLNLTPFIDEGDSCNQSRKNPVSASAMLTRKILQNRKVFATRSLLAEESLDTLQYKISRKYAKCPDELESFRTI